MTQFDRAAAESVPPFPRLVMVLTKDGRAMVQNQPVEIPAGMDARTAALEAVAAYVRDRGIGAVRVLAQDEAGHKWPMVVNAEGQHVDLSNQPGRSGSRAWVLPVGVAALVVMVVVAMVTTVLASRQGTDTQNSAASNVEPSAQPTEYPVLAPDGWTTRARWATGPLASDDAPAKVGADAIAVLTADRKLEVRDVASGNVKWSTGVPRSVVSGPVVTTIDGQQVLAVTTQSDLLWWPTTGSEDPTKLELPKETQEVIWAGSSPLAIRPDQHASVLDGVAWSDRVVPAGSKAVGADGKRLVAADLAGRWWAIETDAQLAPAPRNLRAPQTGAMLTGIAGYANGQLATVWTSKNGRTLVALHDLATRATQSIGTVATNEDPKLTRSGDLIVIDQAAVADTRTRRLRALPAAWSTEAVLPDRVYGRVGEQHQLLRVTGPALLITSETRPVDVSGTTALSFATVDQQPVLYALTQAATALQPKPVPRK
jgi:hypothetical protein